MTPTPVAPASSASSPPPQAVNGLADSPAASPCAEVELRGEEDCEKKEEEKTVMEAEAEASASVQPPAPTSPPPHGDEAKESSPTPSTAADPPRPVDTPAAVAPAVATVTASLSSSSSSSSLSGCPAPAASVLGPPPGLPPLVPPPALEETQSREAAAVLPDVTDAPSRKADAPTQLAADSEDALKQSNSRKTSATGTVG